MTPWPGARTTLPDGEELTVVRAAAPAGAGLPGEVLEAGRRFVVACGAGALELLVVQPPGKRPMAGDEFLRGRRYPPGLHLGAAP
jgi:methionyl-tRNA formyltransferase